MVAIIEAGGSGGPVVAERLYFRWEYRATLDWVTEQCRYWRDRCPGIPFYGRFSAAGRHLFPKNKTFPLYQDGHIRQSAIPYSRSVLGF